MNNKELINLIESSTPIPAKIAEDLNRGNDYLQRKLSAISLLQARGFVRYFENSGCVWLRNAQGDIYGVSPTGETFWENSPEGQPTEPYGC